MKYETKAKSAIYSDIHNHQPQILPEERAYISDIRYLREEQPCIYEAALNM